MTILRKFNIMQDKNKRNKQLGVFGENFAKKYLIGKGFEFVTENYFTSFGEIDLIFKDGSILVFVEVKTRRNKKDLEIAISHSKTKKIYKSAEVFLEREKIDFSETRFDVVFIRINKEDQAVEIGHRPNFF
ncbi:MAG: YraN family protein [Brevinema sp.]